jgi:microcompartment protein CcmL/EutN
LKTAEAYEAHRVAEVRAVQEAAARQAEATARQAAEKEVARLREELERIRRGER